MISDESDSGKSADIWQQDESKTEGNGLRQ